MKLTFEHRSIPKSGEIENGDAVLVRHHEEGALIAVIDALGHGDTAAAVSRNAVEHLGAVKLDAGVRPILDSLHAHLRSSRGAAAMICSIRGARLEGCAIGNVEMRSYRTKVPSVLTPGVIGGTMNRPRFFEADLAPGGRLIIFTDGISSRFDGESVARLPAREACETLLGRHRRAHDDATVLITDIEA